MKFILDTNIIISALIKDSLSRKIITNYPFDFFVPSFAFSEILKYKKYICKKASISEKRFIILLNKISEHLIVVPVNKYKREMKKAHKLISDKKDVAFLACALALRVNIWSDDKHFMEQKKIKVFTTKDFVKSFLKSKEYK